MRERARTDHHRAFLALLLTSASLIAAALYEWAFAWDRHAPHDAALLIQDRLHTDAARVAGTSAIILLAIPTSCVVGALVAAIRCWLQTGTFVREVSRDSGRAPARLIAAARDARVDAALDFVRDERLVACTHGVLRPRIVISKGLVDALTYPQLMAAVHHEAHHLRCRDPLRIVIARVLAQAFWLFPITRGMQTRLLLRIELAADNAAMRNVSRSALAGALLHCLEAAPPAAAGLHAPRLHELRITHIAAPTSMPPIRASRSELAATVILVVAIMGMAAAFNASTNQHARAHRSASSARLLPSSPR